MACSSRGRARGEITAAAVQASGATEAGRPSASTFSGNDPAAVRCRSSQPARPARCSRSPERRGGQRVRRRHVGPADPVPPPRPAGASPPAGRAIAVPGLPPGRDHGRVGRGREGRQQEVSPEVDAVASAAQVAREPGRTEAGQDRPTASRAAVADRRRARGIVADARAYSPAAASSPAASSAAVDRVGRRSAHLPVVGRGRRQRARVVDRRLRRGRRPVQQPRVPPHEVRPVAAGKPCSHLRRRPQRPAHAVQLDAAVVRLRPARRRGTARPRTPRRRLHPPQEVQDPLGVGQVPGPGQRGRGQRRVARPDVAPGRAPARHRYAVGSAQHLQVEQSARPPAPATPRRPPERCRPPARRASSATSRSVSGVPASTRVPGTTSAARASDHLTAGPDHHRVGVQRHLGRPAAHDEVAHPGQAGHEQQAESGQDDGARKFGPGSAAAGASASAATAMAAA